MCPEVKSLVPRIHGSSNYPYFVPILKFYENVSSPFMNCRYMLANLIIRNISIPSSQMSSLDGWSSILSNSRYTCY